MTVTWHGIDGWLFFLACACFLIAAILAWVSAGHRAVMTLIAAGLLFATLTHLVR